MIGSGPTQVVLGHFPQSPFFRSKSGFAVDLGCDLPSVPECTSPCKLFKPSGLFPRDVNRPHIGKRERLAASYHVGDRSYSGDHPTLRHGALGQAKRRRELRPDRCIAFAGTLASKKIKPSAAVGCVKIASRSIVYGKPPSIAV